METDQRSNFADPLKSVSEQLDRRNTQAALELARPVLDGRDARAVYLLARMFADAGQMPEACGIMQRCVALEPDRLEFLLTLANCLVLCKRHADAVEIYRRAAVLKPDNPNILHALAHNLIVTGELGEAEKLLWKVVTIDPAMAAGHYLLSGLRRYQSRNDRHIALLENTLAEFGGSRRDFSRMSFALGRALDSVADYTAAFEWIRKANDARKAESTFDIEADRRLVDRIIHAYPGELFTRNRARICEADWPVLIVGMPRSGTTLVEQILACHPQVHGAGEIMALMHTLQIESKRFLPRGTDLPDAAASMPDEGWQHLGEQYAARLRHFDPDAARIADKQLFNYYELGAARMMLPRIRIIHCIRDPMDTCLSCYFTSFRRDRGYTYSLSDLGESYRLYRRLMRHWESVIPDVFTIRYERLIEDQRGTTEALLEYVGLPWSEACMNFQESTRNVATSSQTQVREKIHSRSVGRWKNYREQLEPLRNIIDRRD